MKPQSDSALFIKFMQIKNTLAHPITSVCLNFLMGTISWKKNLGILFIEQHKYHIPQ